MEDSSNPSSFAHFFWHAGSNSRSQTVGLSVSIERLSPRSRHTVNIVGNPIVLLALRKTAKALYGHTPEKLVYGATLSPVEPQPLKLVAITTASDAVCSSLAIWTMSVTFSFEPPLQPRMRDRLQFWNAARKHSRCNAIDQRRGPKIIPLTLEDPTADHSYVAQSIETSQKNEYLFFFSGGVMWWYWALITIYTYRHSLTLRIANLYM